MTERAAKPLHPIDVHVGRQVRRLRRSRGVSQSALAGRLGLTFQQIQKYERGRNRISASKLYEIGAALGAPVGHFFEGLAWEPAPGGAAAGLSPSPLDVLLDDPDGMILVASFPNIRSRRLRRVVAHLARALAETKA